MTSVPTIDQITGNTVMKKIRSLAKTVIDYCTGVSTEISGFQETANTADRKATTALTKATTVEQNVTALDIVVASKASQTEIGRLDTEIAPLIASVAVTAGASTDIVSTEKVGVVHSVPLPIADASKAGLINPAMFSAYEGYDSRIDALESAVTPLPVTGLTEGMSNSQVLAIYTATYPTYTVPPTIGTVLADYSATVKYTWNDTDWIYSPIAVTVDKFTNSALGTIKGSTTDGQVFAESDGTGSVNGFDAMATDVMNNASEIAGLSTRVTAEETKSATLIEDSIATVGKTDSGAGGLVTLSGYNKAGTLKSSATIKNATSTDAVADENVVLTKAQYDALASGGNGGDYTLYGSPDYLKSSNAIVVKRYDGRKFLVMDNLTVFDTTTATIQFSIDPQIFVDYPILLGNITPVDNGLDMNIGECSKYLNYYLFNKEVTAPYDVNSYTHGSNYIQLSGRILIGTPTIAHTYGILAGKFAIRLE